MIDTIDGVFVREHKNRFLCSVNVNDIEIECYIPNSSKLQNYLDPEGREVLLTRNKAQKSRTEFSLFAIKYNEEYILLNLNMTNKLIKDLIIQKKIYNRNNFIIQAEKIVDQDYKTDLFLVDQKKNIEIIVELKSVISLQERVLFPGVISQRSIKQLKKIKELLIKGKEIHYLLIALSPTIKEIYLEANSEYGSLLKECILNGLKLEAIRLMYDGVNVYHDDNIKIRI